VSGPPILTVPLRSRVYSPSPLTSTGQARWIRAPHPQVHKDSDPRKHLGFNIVQSLSSPSLSSLITLATVSSQNRAPKGQNVLVNFIGGSLDPKINSLTDEEIISQVSSPHLFLLDDHPPPPPPPIGGFRSEEVGLEPQRSSPRDLRNQTMGKVNPTIREVCLCLCPPLDLSHSLSSSEAMSPFKNPSIVSCHSFLDYILVGTIALVSQWEIVFTMGLTWPRRSVRTCADNLMTISRLPRLFCEGSDTQG
jgi:hypothetical protein